MARARSAVFRSLGGRCANGCCASPLTPSGLIDELEGLDWPEGIKLLQRNWIGRSEGAEIEFRRSRNEGHESDELQNRVFTTRPDTLYGATTWCSRRSIRSSISSDRGTRPASPQNIARRSRAKAIWNAPNWPRKRPAFSPALTPSIQRTNEKIPIWIADYVLMGYGTGAIMGVPAHDERDLEFAQKIRSADSSVVQPPGRRRGIDRICRRRHRDQFAAHQWPADAGSEKENHRRGWRNTGSGKRAINYKLRDWLFSRQRYWGEPFPIVWEEWQTSARYTKANCRSFRRRWKISSRPAPASRHWRERRIGFATPTKRRARPTPCRNGRAPAGITCVSAIRITTTRFVGEEAERYWMGGRNRPGGVDLYVGGTEHAVLHLLICALLAQGAFRSRPPFETGTVPAPGEPGNNPGRRRPQNVEALGQRHRSARCHRRVRRGCVSLLRNVHGPARADEAVEHERGGRRLAFSRPRLAFDHGRKSGRRMAVITAGAGSGARRNRSERSCTPRSRKSPKTSRLSLSTPPSRR